VKLNAVTAPKLAQN